MKNLIYLQKLIEFMVSFLGKCGLVEERNTFSDFLNRVFNIDPTVFASKLLLRIFVVDCLKFFKKFETLNL